MAARESRKAIAAVNLLEAEKVRRQSRPFRELVAYGPFPQFEGGSQRYVLRSRYSAGMAEKIV
jgi:hypothetical protein